MEKTWFEERIGKTVVREYVYLDKKEESEFVVTEKNVGYLWLLTEKGYTYREAKGDDDWLEAAKPVLRIHKTLQACVSCEG